jgi:hypothetical protein
VAASLLRLHQDQVAHQSHPQRQGHIGACDQRPQRSAAPAPATHSRASGLRGPQAWPPLSDPLPTELFGGSPVHTSSGQLKGSTAPTARTRRQLPFVDAIAVGGNAEIHPVAGNRSRVTEN